MNETNAAFAYQQSSARSATPVGQVVALYDTILRDFRRANEAQAAGNVENRVLELNHTLAVIGHLRGVLDHERGGEAAKRLERFYEVTHAMILQASVSGERETVNKLIELYSSLRQAWQLCEKQIAAGSTELPTPPVVPPAVRAPQTAAASDEEPASTRSNWSG
jgi:flagellar secretion chaperone FliS